MSKYLTKLELLTLQAVDFRPDQWLNVHGNYTGEVLALQCKGLVATRLIDNQLQIKRKDVGTNHV